MRVQTMGPLHDWEKLPIGTSAKIEVAKMNKHGIANPTLDHRTRDCAHRPGVGWVWLVHIPGIHFPVVRLSPIFSVPPKDQCVVNVRILDKWLEHLSRTRDRRDR